MFSRFSQVYCVASFPYGSISLVYSGQSSPINLTFLFSLLFWAGESVVLHKPMSLPTDASSWGSVIYISFFIRGLYGIVQIYALRYVSPLNTSLIFSSEIIMTMFMSPILTLVFGSDPEQITLLKAAGGVVMVMGILAADSSVVESIKRRFVRVEK